MRKSFPFVLVILILATGLLSCRKKDKWFDTDQEINPRVRYANYVDKTNAFKLRIPPGVWKVVPVKKARLALVNRKCIGKVIVKSEWLLSDQYAEEAERIAVESFDGQFEWLDKKSFFVGDWPAVIVSARGRILHSKAEEFYVERTVAAGVIKYGSRQCQFKYVAPDDCYANTKNDLMNLMLGFERIERFSSGSGEEPQE
ncbi:MAG: hypothetical protein JW759_07825 [Candidatus Coatesbacteria bacterium]|nr:hypothetical protein [Candidatus Coatesbacteria bacterium]